MTISQRRKKIENLTRTIERLMNSHDRGPIRQMWLKHAVVARSKHQKIVEQEEQITKGELNDNTQV